MTTNYEEFDDVVRIELYVTSSKAVLEMRRLAVKHGLGFLFNPGGGQFTAPGFNCQISCCDDVEDLNKLRKALESKAYGREQNENGHV